MTRFRDTGERLTAFTGEVLVVCPSCGGRATVTERRGVCGTCAWTTESPAGETSWGEAHDPWLRLPLWLVTPVGEHVLWAFDAKHLDLLEAYVAADLRERPAERETGGAASLLERLPPWTKAAKNRDAVLAGIARLRARLAEA